MQVFGERGLKKSWFFDGIMGRSSKEGGGEAVNQPELYERFRSLHAREGGVVMPNPGTAPPRCS